MTPLRILGIDPGSHHLGIGVVEKNGNRLSLVFVDILHAPAKSPIYERLELLHAKLLPLVQRFAPQEVAVEDTFAAKNTRTAFRLGIARGVAIAACLGRNTPIYEYAPAQVKAVVTGHGGADKNQVQKMVCLILGAGIDLGYDATDALAVAICHAYMGRLAGALNDRARQRENPLEKR